MDPICEACPLLLAPLLTDFYVCREASTAAVAGIPRREGTSLKPSMSLAAMHRAAAEVHMRAAEILETEGLETGRGLQGMEIREANPWVSSVLISILTSNV